jgi:hypothetical protein
MYRAIRIVVATAASALALAPAALAGGVTPDNRADRTGPAGVKAANPDTTGVGLMHASMVYAQIAARPPASTEAGFDWADAGVGAALGVVLTSAGIAAATRNRRRELAA